MTCLTETLLTEELTPDSFEVGMNGRQEVNEWDGRTLIWSFSCLLMFMYCAGPENIRMNKPKPWLASKGWKDLKKPISTFLMCITKSKSIESWWNSSRYSKMFVYEFCLWLHLTSQVNSVCDLTPCFPKLVLMPATPCCAVSLYILYTYVCCTYMCSEKLLKLGRVTIL